MKIQEIKHTIKCLQSECEMADFSFGCKKKCETDGADCYIKLSIEALEKQIPMKPKEVHKEALVKDGIFDWQCSCGRFHRNDFLLNYCSECGQKIDWSD